jgi:putative phosphoribosyl transferase
LNPSVIAELGITERDIASVADREAAELARRERSFRGNQPPAELRGRVVVLVDDGLATGSTMRAAITAVRQRGPEQVVVAVPVGAKETCAELAHEVDTLICPLQPDALYAIGMWYEDFAQTTDEEVREALALAAQEEQGHAGHREGNEQLR